MSTMEDRKLKTLVDQLYLKTRLKRLEWKSGFGENAVETEIGGNTIRLEQQFEIETEELYVEIVLKSANGMVIHRIIPAHLAEFDTGIADKPKYWQVMDDLYELAERQAKGVDQAIEEILDALMRRN